jgi:hypothetical protein
LKPKIAEPLIYSVFTVAAVVLAGFLWWNIDARQAASEEWVKNNPPKFEVGEIVRVKIDSARATVLIRYGPLLTENHRWRYDCRISAPRQQSRDGLVSADTVIAAYTIVSFQEYELEKEK